MPTNGRGVTDMSIMPCPDCGHHTDTDRDWADADGRCEGCTAPTLDDEYGIGQQARARVVMSVAKSQLARSWHRACDPGYMPSKWRKMYIRLVKDSLADIRMARRVMGQANAR